MKDLSKWQFMSFVSRAVAMGIGLIQSIIILRILSVSEWGLIQIALGVGGALGIYQHLGLASASTREISTAKDDSDIFKVFVTSVVVRYVITIPIALGLFFSSDYLAQHVYSSVDIAPLLKIYAVVLLVQGFQSILNSVISGTKRFKELFLYQAGIAFVSLFLYVPLVYKFKALGYFYALGTFAVIATTTLSFIAFVPLRGNLVFPKKKDFKRLFKDIFSISIGVYLIKIIYMNWEKLGPNILGITESAQTVGVFAFALTYGKKLMAISDAVTDVNLPVLSDKFVNDFKEFKKIFIHNFNKIFSLIMFFAMVSVFWSREVIFFVIGGDKYAESVSLILPMVFAFMFYAIVNIVKSSVIIPARMIKEMVLSYIFMILCTALFYFSTVEFLGNLKAMSYGMAFGGLIGLVTMILSSQMKLRFKFFDHGHVLILLQGLVIGLSGGIENILIKAIAFLAFTVLFIWGIFSAGFVTKGQAISFFNNLYKFLFKRKAVRFGSKQ